MTPAHDTSEYRAAVKGLARLRETKGAVLAGREVHLAGALIYRAINGDPAARTTVLAALATAAHREGRRQDRAAQEAAIVAAPVSSELVVRCGPRKGERVTIVTPAVRWQHDATVRYADGTTQKRSARDLCFPSARHSTTEAGA